MCEACLSELFDPASRFYRYPLVNCTHCGPRYTLTRALPYDRAQTSMAPFAMCPDCARDYADPSNRRFHAEPTACRVCGPKLDAEIADVADCMREGGIVALKGLGGYHLICDAHDEATVARLRRRKAREAKPFAVMATNAASAARVAEISEAERGAARIAPRPIVLARSRGVLAPSVAPGLAEVGLMLAYTPLQWLVLHALAGEPDFAAWRDAANDLALVATSANLGGEPLIADDDEARRRLAPIADLIVGHARANRRARRRFGDADLRWRAGLHPSRARLRPRADRPRRRRAERARRRRRPQEHDHADARPRGVRLAICRRPRRPRHHSLPQRDDRAI